MTPSRKKPGVAFWATVVVVVGMVAYPLSFGPASWLLERVPTFHRPFVQMYWPVGWMAAHGPRPVRKAIWGYATVGVPRGTIVALPTGPGGTTALSICQRD